MGNSNTQRIVLAPIVGNNAGADEKCNGHLISGNNQK